MTHPHTLDAETDVDLDLDGPPVGPPPSTSGPAGVLDAESNVGEWDTPTATTTRQHAAVPRPGRPGKAEVNAEHEDRAERRRGERRRRKVSGVVLTTVILASAAASVFGWPVVLAGLGVAGGTTAVGVAATKGAKNANGGGRRGIRGGGAGYSQGGNRRRLFGGGGGRGGGLFGGRGRGGGGAGGRRGGGLGLGSLGLGGKKAGAGKKAAAGKKPGAGPTAGARSGPAGKKPGGSHRAPKGPGLFKKLTGGGRGRGAGHGGPRANSRFGANNRRRQHQTTPHRRQTHAGGPQRTPRTFRGQARQAKKQAVRQARQQLAQQVGQHRAQRRMRRRNGRIQRRIAASQQRQQNRQAAILRRRQGRAAWRARVNQRRLQRAHPHRAWWRRRFVLAAARARRRGRRWIVQPVRRRTRQLGRWAAGRARAGYRRVSPLYALARRAQLLAMLRQLNPSFGQRQHRRRWRGVRYYTRRALAPIFRLSRSSWDATLGRLFVGLRRLLVAAAAKRRVDLGQLWRDFYSYLARFTPRRRARPVPQPPPRAAGPTLPFRGMDPAQRAAVAATLGMGAGATSARRPPTRRPARPATPARAARPSTRPAMAVPTRPAVRTPRGTRPMAVAAQADAQEVTHPTWEAALSALNDAVATYQIPDDGTGVLDVDSFISSIGGFMNGLSTVLDSVGSELSEGPTNHVVVEQLAEFSTAITAMAGDAAQVYEAWRTNEDNAHDLRRAEGEIQRAELFNVGG